MGLMDGDLARRRGQARRRLPRRQSAAAFLFPFLLGACGVAPGVEQAAAPRPDWLGSVAAGEPNAALAARDILRAGGSAVDAAAALAMALAVTRPSRAGLWAGGVCLVNDSEDGGRWAYSFIHPGSREGEAPPPMLARGLALMHAAHGRLRWGALPAAAERLALLGHPVSRAFARDVEAAPARARAVLPGRPLAEGDLLVQPELGRVLQRIRLDGPAAIRSGPLAAELMRGAAAAGYRLDEAALERGVPSAQEPLSVADDPWRASFASEETSAGPGQAAFWRRLLEDDGGPPALPAAPDGGAQDMPEDGTGFAAVDAGGLAVACGLTMNAPFGTGRAAAGAGMAIAAPARAARAGPAISPFPVTVDSGGGIRLAGAAFGAGRTGFAAAVLCRAWDPGDPGPACRAYADPRGAGLAVQVFDE